MFFLDERLERERYVNNLNLIEFFKSAQIDTEIHNSTDEFVAVWLDCIFFEPTQKYRFISEVKVYFQNLGLDSRNEAFISIRVPITCMHKVTIGSIWKNGISTERFKPSTYTYKINSREKNFEKQNYQITSLAEMGKTDSAFDLMRYSHKLQFDRNPLIIIEKQNKLFTAIIHPLTVFINHYGYSIEIKNLITNYAWSDIVKKLELDKKLTDADKLAYGIDESVEYIFLPKNLSESNQDFLNNLRHNEKTLKTVKSLNSNILLKKGWPFGDRHVTVDFWHKQEIILKLQGYIIGNSFLCCDFAGISHTQGKKVFIIKNETRVNLAEDFRDSETLLRPFKYPYLPGKLEKLEISEMPVNNGAMVGITRTIELIGKPRKTKTIIINTDNSSRKKYSPIQQPSPRNFSFGQQSSIGTTGRAISYLQPRILDSSTEGDPRIEALWEHAKTFSKSAQWFTLQHGFLQSDDVRAMDVSPLHGEDRQTTYPEKVFVVRIIVDEIEYFILEFGIRINQHGKTIKKLRGLAFKNCSNADFLGLNSDEGTSEFMKLMHILTTSNGMLSAIDINEYNLKSKGKITNYNHRFGVSNNWVQTAIQKLSVL